MAVISKLIHNGKDITKLNNSTLERITIKENSEKNLLDVKTVFMYHTDNNENYFDYERTETGFKAEFLKATTGTSWRIGYRIGLTSEFAGKTITASYGEYIGTGTRPYLIFFSTNLENEYFGSTGTFDTLATTREKQLTFTIPETI